MNQLGYEPEEVFNDYIWRILGPYETLQDGDEGFNPNSKQWQPVSQTAIARGVQLRNIVYRRRKLPFPQRKN